MTRKPPHIFQRGRSTTNQIWLGFNKGSKPNAASVGGPTSVVFLWLQHDENLIPIADSGEYWPGTS